MYDAGSDAFEDDRGDDDIEDYGAPLEEDCSAEEEPQSEPSTTEATAPEDAWKKAREKKEAARALKEAEENRQIERAQGLADRLAATAYRDGHRIRLDLAVLLGGLARCGVEYIVFDQPDLPGAAGYHRVPMTFERKKLWHAREAFLRAETGRFDDLTASFQYDKARGERMLCFEWNKGRGSLRLAPSTTLTFFHAKVVLPEHLVTAADLGRPGVEPYPYPDHAPLVSLRSKDWHREQARKRRALQTVERASAAFYEAIGIKGPPPEASVARARADLCPLCLGLRPPAHVKERPPPVRAVRRAVPSEHSTPNSIYSERARKAWQTRRQKAQGAA